jgi:5'(3')-deoxyribonucleotidase
MLAIDFDSVLADTMITWLEEYNKRNSTSIIKNDVTHWDITKVLQISINEISQIFNYLWKYRWQDIPPTEPNLNITTREIHIRGYRISILTKRYRSSVAHVAEWLDIHDIYCDDLIFIFDGTSKAKYPFNTLIDDTPVNLIDVSSPQSAILFNQPWNKDFDWPVRVDSLKEAEQKLF